MKTALKFPIIAATLACAMTAMAKENTPDVRVAQNAPSSCSSITEMIKCINTPGCSYETPLSEDGKQLPGKCVAKQPPAK